MTINTNQQTIAERRAEIAKRMHIAEMDDGFHIQEVPLGDGAPAQIEAGPFRTRRGVEMFVDFLSENESRAASPTPSSSKLMICLCELEGRLLNILEEPEMRSISGARDLARALSEYWLELQLDHVDCDEKPGQA